MSNKLGFDDNDENLTVNNSDNNPYDTENIIVLNSCTRKSYTIAIVDLTTISNKDNQITENNMVTPRAVQTVKIFSMPGSYSSPIDKIQLQYDVYPNRLKKYIHFYRQMVRNNDTKDKLDYIVGIYKHIENNVVYSEILFSDFDTLFDYR